MSDDGVNRVISGRMYLDIESNASCGPKNIKYGIYFNKNYRCFKKTYLRVGARLSLRMVTFNVIISIF